MNKNATKPWRRAIIFIDMDAFFASIEQLDNLKLRSKPIAITNGLQGSCIITCSYEARAYGIKTGMRFHDALQICPQLIRCSSRPKRYAEVSGRIMKALEDITPDIEIFSVDEAFLEVTYCQKLHGDPITIGKMAKEKVWQASHLTCSVGVSGDKTTAKYAAKLNKPNGFTIIEPWNAKKQLAEVPVTDLCGIASGIGGFLARHGVHLCGDMQKLPISVLARRFGNIGRRIWYMCQGADPEPISKSNKPPKSMGHSKVMPPHVIDAKTILTYLMHMSEKLAARLRRHELYAQIFFIAILDTYDGWLSDKLKVEYPTDDGRIIYQLCQYFFKHNWTEGHPIAQVQITALDPQSFMIQEDLFRVTSDRRRKLTKTIDAINERFGEFQIAPAPLLNRSPTPNVISQSWKPSGHRQTLPKVS